MDKRSSRGLRGVGSWLGLSSLALMYAFIMHASAKGS
jgi:hypothetical protein